MPWFPSALAALFLAAIVGAWMVAAARRKRARHTFPDAQSSEELLAEPRDELPEEPFEQPYEEQPYEEQPYEEQPQLAETGTVDMLSMHETPTREFPVHADAPDDGLLHDGALPRDPAAYDDETAAMQPFDAAALQRLGETLCSAPLANDEGEHTHIYEPDAQMLEILREASPPAVQPVSAREAESTQPIETAASEIRSASRTDAPSLAGDQAHALIRAERARASIRSESFYIQSNVNSEERLTPKRARAATPARNDGRSSGYAPSDATGSSNSGAPPQGSAKGRGTRT